MPETLHINKVLLERIRVRIRLGKKQARGMTTHPCIWSMDDNPLEPYYRLQPGEVGTFVLRGDELFFRPDSDIYAHVIIFPHTLDVLAVYLP